VRRSIAAVGRVLVTLGLLILLFVGYQLWGTGIFTARAQSDLRNEFQALLDATTTTVAPVTVDPAAPTTTTLAPPPPSAIGDPVGFVKIDEIGVNKVVVQGTDRDELKKGPGHYPATPLPGQVGNAAIAGHRTTYGAPFFDLDKLEVGDEIVATTLVGPYTYEVKWIHVVKPTDVWVAGPVEGWAGHTPPGLVVDPSQAWLTLTTCNPKYSARERLIVHALLKEDTSPPPAQPPPTTVPVDPPRELAQGPTLADGLSGEQKSLGPAWGWGSFAALIGLVWWWFFRRWRHPLTWAAGVVPFLAGLFVFYVYLERALPAGY
jgi:sortase A